MPIHQNPNPYASPSGIAISRTRFSIAVPLLALLWLAMVSAGWFMFGAVGATPAVALIGISWFALSRTTTTKLRPINRRRMTLAELFTILTVCVILHGLSMPSVSTAPRRATPAGAPVPAAQSPGGNSYPLVGRGE